MQVGKSRVALTTILNAVAVAVTIATAAPVQAAGTHPVTGEALSTTRPSPTACWTSSPRSTRS